MKKLILFLIPIALCMSACNRPPTYNYLEEALVLSGSNRIELEKVLAHYAINKKDSLKLWAAVFLIENMPGHYSYYSTRLDEYKKSVGEAASLKKIPWHIRNIFHAYPYREGKGIGGSHKREDVACITAVYLIDNIERAFEAWQRPWAKHLGFSDFCEYLLPYRVENEPLFNWRDSLSGIYADVLEQMNGIDEIFESPYQACLQINDCMIAAYQKARADSVSFEHSLVGNKSIHSMECPEFVYGTVFVMRALGIPVSIEMIEQWSSRSGKHYWNAVYHFTGMHYPFTGYESRPRGLNQDYKMNKIYRQVYSINKDLHACHLSGEEMPPFFRNLFLKDVTTDYMSCFDITVTLDREPEEERKYAYLCVFDNENWIPVHWGHISRRQVKFTKVGPQTLFIAAYYINGQIVPASLPFRVNLDGSITYIQPADERISLHIDRKYPLLRKFANFSRHFIGATFEASAYPDFRRVDTICTVRHDANTTFDSIRIEPKQRNYRYLRIKNNNPSIKLNLAELEFYEADTTQRLSGRPILSSGKEFSIHRGEVVFNNSLLDYIEISDWLGFDFGRNVEIQKIRFLPRTDDNHVFPGDSYELFYFDGRFRSLGRVKALSASLSFENVPAKALYLLKDITKGREHRVFTYENNRILFW